MNKPLITTIIPTHCRPKLLRRAIKSVLNQTYSNVQVCVYDDASNDETADVVAGIIKEDSRVSYRCHFKNIGSGSNYNYGLKNVRTPFFSLLSDDDILLPEFYEIAINCLYKYPEAAFCATEVIGMKPDGTVIETANSTWGDGYYLPPEGLLSMFENGHHPPIWTGTLFRTMIIEHIGLFDDKVGATYDRDYTQRVAARFPYVKSKVPGAIYLSNPLSESVNSDHSIVWPGSLKMISNLTDDKNIPLAIRERISLYLMEALKLRIIAYGKQYIKEKKYGKAYQISDILYDRLDKKLWALMIYTTAKCCQVIPFLQSILLFFIDMRHRLNSQRRIVSIPDTENYARYLNEM